MENTQYHLKNSLLIISCASKGYGSGHLVKSSILLDRLSFSKKELYTFITPKQDNIFYSYKDLLSYIGTHMPSVIILDKRETPKRIIKKIRALSSSVIIIFDSIGRECVYADLVIHTLVPSHFSLLGANFSGAGFLPLQIPHDVPEKPGIFRILVCFGNEDRNNLCSFFLKNLKNIVPYLFPGNTVGSDIQIDIVAGKYSRHINKISKKAVDLRKSLHLPVYRGLSITVEVHSHINDLSSYLHTYSLLFTSFGLMPFEAIASGLPFLLINHTKYHNRLANEYFKGANLGMKDRLTLPPSYDIICSQLSAYKNKIDNKYPFLCDIIDHTAIDDFLRACPLCSSKNLVVEKRSETYNIYRCRSCSLYMLKPFIKDTSTAYDKNYFLDEYRKQYSKTYEEDRDNIYRLCESRIRTIGSIINKNQGNYKKLLDIGSALGFFLDRAKKQGFAPEGVEISDYAADFAEKNGHTVFRGNFLETVFHDTYDIVTAWYVFEHFSDFNAVLKKISSIVHTNSIICIATPNGNGFSSVFARKEFLSMYPKDHYYTFSPNNIISLFNSHGYRHIMTRHTGIHPERIKKRFPFKPFFLIRMLYPFIARIFHLGDTFEIYFQKK
ncbi:class I SAM-dependent methyltransferase [Spirochaetota bacterium]